MAMLLGILMGKGFPKNLPPTAAAAHIGMSMARMVGSIGIFNAVVQ
jgi:hypothetical protein